MFQIKSQRKMIHICIAQYPLPTNIAVTGIIKGKGVNKPEMWAMCTFPELFSRLKKGAT
jgi:hypothetical protein